MKTSEAPQWIRFEPISWYAPPCRICKDGPVPTGWQEIHTGRIQCDQHGDPR